MKKCLPILFTLLLSLCSFSQESSQSIGVSISNNGQLKNVMHEYYFNPIGEYEPGNDVIDFKQLELTFNLNYTYSFKNEYYSSINISYGVRKDKYNLSGTDFITGSENQSYYSLTVAFGKAVYFDKFSVYSSVGVPLIFVSDYESKYIDNNPNQILHATTVIDGGIAFGLNNNTGIRWFLNDKLSVFTSVTIGIIHFNLGGYLTGTIDSQDPIIITQLFEPEETSYKLTSFTMPEFQFGISYHL